MSGTTGLGAWAAVYAGYDDAALATLANAGLVRRARKDVAAGRVEVLELRPDEAVLSVGGACVELDARGPAGARCACPTPGACQHVVAACLWARDAAAEPADGTAAEPADGTAAEPVGPVAVAHDDVAMVQPSAAESGAEPDANHDADREARAEPDAGRADAAGRAGAGAVGPAMLQAGVGATPEPDRGRRTGSGADPLAEILALDPRAVHRAAGAAVVRVVARDLREVPGASPDDTTEMTVDGPRVVVSWHGAPRVTYVAGAGFAGMLVERERAGGTAQPARADDRRWRLEALARVWRARDRTWPWPEEPDVAAPRATGVPDARTVADDVARAVERVLDVGLSHLGRDDLEELRGAGVLARLGRRPVVQRLVTSAVGRLEALADRRDAVDEEECLLALAELWAFVRAEPAPDTVAPDERVTDRPRLVPLGARWWVAASGARGVTVHLWDADEGRTRSVTTGRPPGADPTFRRSWDLPLVWGRSLEALCRGPFALRGATERAGGLRAGDGPVVEALGALTADALRDVAERTAATDARAEVGFGRRPTVVRVVMVRDAGPVGVDEVAQEVTWTLVAADGAPTVVRVDAADEAACDTLLGVAAGNRRVVAVATEHDLESDRSEAVGLFVEHPGGELRLVVPTLTPAYDHRTWSTAWTRLRARVRALRGRATTHAREVVVPSPVEDVCDTVLDAAVALAATGRRHLSPHQVASLARAARTADDLGASTLAGAVALVAREPDAARLLRAALVASRGRALARAVAAAPGHRPIDRAARA
ncbi:hypothetical protein [Cellulosimicrobium protaetiae]|uniref:SWIM-type domain-containing protein n=1 Tax=Cellulosimicrobium protaetiae TaxID=2587808 RepID=A0A6M5UD87_9MICO|nr:hypothetical protein [Cellulosimicrobium protaetiae]QJW36486.1 hypothetical protein FIC82_010075 [Cellulosimicrobium protaetiae]